MLEVGQEVYDFYEHCDEKAVSPNDSQHHLIDLEVPSLIRTEIP